MNRPHIYARTIVCLAALLAAFAIGTAPTLAQSNIDSTNKYASQENCGWTNWRDAGNPVAAQGVVIKTNFIAGFAWGENIGWINLGDGTPANAISYANATGADFGVNRNSANGNLTGFAWGENVGWINFSGGDLASPPQPARFDSLNQRFHGYAWGENIGWINLDDANHFIGANPCPADFNQSGQVTVQDIFDFLAAYFGNDPRADFNHSGAISVQDIFDFLAAYFAGCA